MERPPDVPDIWISKPKKLEEFEKLEPHILNAMTQQEVTEHIRDIAISLAETYQKEKGGDYEGCVITVSTALKVTGGAIGGKVGAEMVGESPKAAESACKLVFRTEEL